MKLLLRIWAVLASSAVFLLAASGTEQLVGEYEPMVERPGLPDGVYALLLDPGRRTGWNSWFSELPNDLEKYAFAVHSTRDVQRLIDIFCKVADPKRRLTLHPGRGPRGLGDFRPAAKGREWGAVLSVSNRQKLADANARELSHGKPAPYVPAPTTLDIFLGSVDVELLQLKLPRDLTVGTLTESPFPGRAYAEQQRKIRAFKQLQP